MLHAALRGHGGTDDPGGVGHTGQQGRRHIEPLLTRQLHREELPSDRGLLGPSECSLLHQLPHEVTEAAFRGNTPGRGVRLGEQAGLFQPDHLVAYRGRADVRDVLAHDLSGPDGSSGADIGLHNRLQDQPLARTEGRR